jgi:hypothetical protein
MTERMDDRRFDRPASTADIADAANERVREIDERDRVLDREVELRARDTVADDYEQMRLLPDDIANELRPRWADVQASFVDEPRRAVEDADALVADAIRRLAEAFARARSDLERDWDRGDEVSTEDLRLAFRRYRTFFDRLLEM